MLRAFYSSATGMRAQEVLIDNTANNLANVNTTGFKRSQIEFADLLYSNERTAGAEVASGQLSPVGLQIGSGVRVVGTSKVFAQGVPQQTGVPTDVAIEGDGFFKIIMPGGGERFTRNGAFQIDGQSGSLVTSDGFLLDGGVTIPSDIALEDLTIGIEGNVSAPGNSSIGQIALYRFANPVGLQNEGGNLYSATDGSGPADPGTPGQNVGFLRQRSLEGSNVEVVRELVSLITAQRAYEINSRAIQAGDEMLANTAQLTR